MTQLIVVPQENEFAALVAGFGDVGVALADARIGNIVGRRAPQLDSLLAVAGHGKAQFAATTSYLLSQLPDVELVVCAGAAGSLAADLALGDIVVSTVTVEHDYRVRFVPQPLPKHICDAESVTRLRRVVGATPPPFTVHFGRIASGDEDIVDDGRAKELYEQTGALCAAWEGSGAARAANVHDRRFIEIRAITDGADESAAADFRTNLAIAMPNLARLLALWLGEDSPKRGKP